MFNPLKPKKIIPLTIYLNSSTTNNCIIVNDEKLEDNF